ncbi:MAG TPA: cell division protein FtsA [Bacteroidia bacterium]|nr:cell division protein FtsA [Bacteroidia bacterium]
MEASDFVVGLDIGTTKIAAIVGRKNEYGKIEILAIGKAPSLGVKRGVVSNIEDTIRSIKAAVADALTKDITLKNEKGEMQTFKLEQVCELNEVVVGIAGQHIKSLQHRGMITRQQIEEEVAQRDVDNLIDNMHRLVMQPGEEIIHVIPQDYIVDNEQGIRNPIGMAGVRLEGNFHIITGQVSAVKNIYKCVDRSSLKVVDLNLEPLASADACLSEEEKEAGVVLVDIGGGTSDVAIFYDGIIRHTAVIPLGGNIITEDIKVGCSIITNQAELLKTKFGSALAIENHENEVISIPGLRGRPHKEISVKNLAHIIQARMEEILAFVLYEIKNSGYEKKLAAGIVVTGGGSQLKHLPQLVEYFTGIDCRIGTPNEHLAKSSENVTNPMFSTGVGLVMMGIKKMEDEMRKTNKTFESKIEVKPEEQEKEKKKPANHSNKVRGKFFETFGNKVADWLRDDVE